MHFDSVPKKSVLISGVPISGRYSTDLFERAGI